MSTFWFVKIDGMELKPLSTTQLKAMAKSGQINLDTLIKRGLDGKWVQARNVKGLIEETVEADSIEQNDNMTSEKSFNEEQIDELKDVPMLKKLRYQDTDNQVSNEVSKSNNIPSTKVVESTEINQLVDYDKIINARYPILSFWFSVFGFLTPLVFFASIILFFVTFERLSNNDYQRAYICGVLSICCFNWAIAILICQEWFRMQARTEVSTSKAVELLNDIYFQIKNNTKVIE